MQLTLDFGNTRTKYGIFNNRELVVTGIWEKVSVADLNALLTNHSIQNIIYSNVSHIDTLVQDWLTVNIALALTNKLSLSITNKYQTPQTLGKDRIAAVMGAKCLYPHQNSLVIDAGTCITYDWLEKGTVYLGGNIAPGLRMRLRAMHDGTSALPLAPLEWQTDLIGKSTLSALQNGALWGAVLEMQGVIDWSTTHWKEINVILTGGDSIFFANHLKRKIFALPDLVLIGLNEILNYHVSLEE